ncbi:MAG TPA: HdeD family acid-resistance protein [Thermoanaerobaculia bacterium]|nr:HdeD family acid-resistance protein [Thermoanaerobaculia bacterium]
MVRTLAQHWWVLLLRGLLAIAFGLMAWQWPGVTIAVLVMFWGAYALVDGLFEVVAGVRAKWGSLVFLGILGIAAGIVTLFWPGITAVALLYIIAFWAIVAGVLQISAAIRLRREIQGEVLWILSGLCTVILGVLLIARPGAGALAVVGLIGAFAIAWGILLVILAFKLKGHAGRLTAKTA